MSQTEKKPLSKLKSVPPSLVKRFKPSLLQTRRHSWFGASQEAPPDSPHGGGLGIGIYDIQEEEELNQKKEEPPTQPWWHIQPWGKANSDNNSSGLRQRKNNNDTGAKNGETLEENKPNNDNFTGLQRKGKNASLLSQNSGSSAKATSSKRRSGLGIWLPISQNNSSDSVFVEEKCRTASPAEGNAKKPVFPSLEQRSTQRRATVHYSSNGRPSLMDLKRRGFQNTLRANEVKALEQLKDVGRDFIVYRLRQRNLSNRVVMERPQSKERWLCREVIFITGELQRVHKCRFSDISKQIGITIRSEDVLRKVFFELSGEIVTTEKKSHHQNGSDKPNDGLIKKSGISHQAPKLPSFGSRYTEITWGRLCAMLAVAGGLAVDCVQQGHADLVNNLVEYIGDFAREEDILNWIVSQGGWEGMREMTYEASSRNSNTDSFYLSRMTNVAVAFVLCTASTLVAALAISSYSRKQEN